MAKQYNLPTEMSVDNLLNAHSQIRELVESDLGAKRLANMIYRLASNGKRTFTNAMNRGVSQVMLNAISPTDGQNPWLLAIDQLEATVLNPDTPMPKRDKLLVIAMSTPNTKLTKQALGWIETGKRFKNQDFIKHYSESKIQALLDEGHALANQRRVLGVTDEEFMATYYPSTDETDSYTGESVPKPANGKTNGKK